MSFKSVIKPSLVQSIDLDWNNVLDSEQLLISQVIDKRRIRWLCHFTRRQNLENIKKFGLVPRNLLPENSFITDRSRYDQHPNAICLSITKPNSWMFKKKQEQGLDLCLLLIDPAILYKKHCLFYPHNAATACYRNMESSYFTGETALEKLFDEVVTYQKSGCAPQHIDRSWNKDLKDCETTSDQAEVQCLEVIEPHYILQIIEHDIPLDHDGILAKCLDFTFNLGNWEQSSGIKANSENNKEKSSQENETRRKSEFSSKKENIPTENIESKEFEKRTYSTFKTISNILSSTLETAEKGEKQLNKEIRQAQEYWATEESMKRQLAEAKERKLESKEKLRRISEKYGKNYEEVEPEIERKTQELKAKIEEKSIKNTYSEDHSKSDNTGCAILLVILILIYIFI
ncbi:DarT ssDNA thymidine ADP-ribosyltransferase family protein [Actinobacillus porcinus]|uniref:DarT ssDNA thymidine ADP-ribosyltransferase family protein n=1 Tax=Actinobacillus porcinus TaxID=51048 RepID=UPI002354575C|nr:DarT ssDNA thymidine ADP-ribosyltransferase family protein [Actinobacillus porcinus]MCI5764280.1 DarT ssDNA thymidine ADP-ribosyltransferase family protein [Actinobacillus porcinus]MDY6215438.1 DarT ssDNA thymidine ADP-ribosyltransferase family protein [Actinobacillus porcinus]